MREGGRGRGRESLYASTNDPPGERERERERSGGGERERERKRDRESETPHTPRVAAMRRNLYLYSHDSATVHGEYERDGLNDTRTLTRLTN